MRKGPGSVYDKWHISVVICDTNIVKTVVGTYQSDLKRSHDYKISLPVVSWVVRRVKPGHDQLQVTDDDIYPAIVLSMFMVSFVFMIVCAVF